MHCADTNLGELRTQSRALLLQPAGLVAPADHAALHSGISRDNWHKRRKTGGKRKPYHKKRKYELGRPPANTKVSDWGELVRIMFSNSSCCFCAI